MDRALETSASASFVRRVLLGKPFLIVVAALVVYTLAGFFLAPYLVKRQLTTYVSEDLGRRLSIKDVSINPYALTLEVSGLALQESDGAPILSFDGFIGNFELKSLFRWAWTFAEIGLKRPEVHVDIRPDDVVNLARLVEAALPNEDTGAAPQPKTEEEDLLPRLYFERIKVEDGILNFSDRSNPTAARAVLKPINLEITHLSTIPGDKGTETIVATLPQGGTLEWKGEITLQPIASEGRFTLRGFELSSAWRFFQDELNLERPQGRLDLTARYSFSYNRETPNLIIDGLEVLVAALSFTLTGTDEPGLVIEKINLTDGRFDLASREFTVGRLAVTGGRVAAAVEEDGRLNWEKLVVEQPTSERTAQTKGSTPFRVGLNSVTVDDIAVNYRDLSRAEPIGVDLDRFSLKLSAQLNKETETLQARIDDMALDVSDLTVLEIGEDKRPISIKRISVQGGQADLAKQEASIDEVALSGGQVEVWRDPKGTINWIRLATGENVGAIRDQGKDSPAKNVSEDRPWAVRLSNVKVEKFDMGLSDRTLKSPEVYRLKNIRLHAKDLHNDPDSTFTFDLNFDVAQGGSATINGTVHPFRPGAEVGLNVNSIALVPLKPYLNNVARLSLDSGAFSVKGDVQYGITGLDAVTFKGDAGLNKLLLTLEKTGKPFLSLTSLGARGIRINTKPKGVVIEDVLLAAPSGNLVIRKDKTLNFRAVLVEDEEGAKEKSGDPEFGFEIKRVRVKDGNMGFSDLGLMPFPFRVKIHKLKGAVVGLSSRPGGRASMKLEGRVGKYGSAIIKGSLQPFDPKKYSNVSMIFRNVEMTNLTPYAASFAGRKITSGKLSMDLGYKINKSQLRGENKIIMDNFVLGEEVEAPGAVDLPLDLAVALLKDTNGRIDIGLPVSGDLENPEFSYGHLIWKALTNLITKIVTAPFRALASLLGTGDETLDAISFQAGDAGLPPSEAEKLVLVGKALKERPQLTLEVQGQHERGVDGLVLKRVSLKQRLARQIGLSLEPGQDPGPLDFTDPALQKAIDTIAAPGLRPDKLAKLRKKFGMTGPEQVKAASSPSTKKPKKTPPPTDKRGFYAEVFGQLVDKEPLDDAALKTLAQERAKAIIQELTTVNGVDAGRVVMVEPVKVGQAEGRLVASKLILSVRKP